MKKRKNLTRKILILSRRFTIKRFRGVFNFLILLKLDKYVSILKLSLLLFPLLFVSIFSNFIVAIITTGLNTILCGLIYTWLEKILFRKKNKFYKDNILYKKKKILAIIIICFMNILSTCLAIKYQFEFTDALIRY